jgi:hypothetical protein
VTAGRHTSTALAAGARRGLRVLGLLAAAAVPPLGAAPEQPHPQEIEWTDARTLGLEGRGWSDTKSFYDRLPQKAEGVVRDAVWQLGHDSAGLCVHFASDAPAMRAKWTLTGAQLALPNMSASGVSGLDLYVKKGGDWRWMAAARAAYREDNEVALFEGLPAERREYLLYLPLYNGIESLRIGVPKPFGLEPVVRPDKPLVFYGTSIVQGGCVARPGMAYPAMLGRRLDLPVVNLGFSGNAHAEPEVAALLAEIDAAVFVLDCLPNLSSDEVARLKPFVAALRAKRPDTPVVLVESLEYPDGAVIPSRRAAYEDSNDELGRIFEALSRTDRHIFHVPARNLVGDDGEGTVDGTHPTDLGAFRMARKMEPVLRLALDSR